MIHLGRPTPGEKGPIMSDQQHTTVTAEAPADPVAAAVLAARMAIIDAAVRRSREQSWCGEFESIMRGLFPDGPPDGSKEFVDSDGWSCRGLDRDGYNEDGWDSDGYNRTGYNRHGYDRGGFDRDGWNQRGWNREGIHRDGRDRNSPELQAVYRFDGQGFDRDGYNRRGQDRFGYTREYNEARGGFYRFDENGRDIDGLDRYGDRY